MFYIKLFLKTFIQMPWKTLSFSLLTVLLVFVASQKGTLENKILDRLPKEENGPYFHALISGKENTSNIQRKLITLPGVEKVKILPAEEIQKEVKDLFDEMQIDISSQLFNMDDVGLKVVFTPALKEGSQKLIRDYLLRLAGEKNVTLGAIRNQKSEESKHTRYESFVMNWSWLTLLLTTGALWLFSALIWAGSVKNVSYIVERFQRRKKVIFKTICVALSVLYFIGITIAAIGGHLVVAPVLAIAILFAVYGLTYLRSTVWEG